MDEQWKFEQQVRKKRGLDWPCASCHLRFPAEAFIDDDRRKAQDKGVSKNDATKEYCITPGHWRRCRACLGLRLDGFNGNDDTHIMIECKHCRQRRPQQYFQESTSKCSACQLQETYAFFECAECHKTTSMKEWNGRFNEGNNRICNYCAPDAAILECQMCKKKKVLQCFSVKYPAQDNHGKQNAYDPTL